MQEIGYQVQYEMAAFIILLVLCVHFFSARRFPSTTNSIFGLVLIVSILDVFFDIISCYTIFLAAEVPVWLNYWVNLSFFSIQTLLPALVCVYIVYTAKSSFLRHKAYFLMILPGIAYDALLYSTPWTGLIFSMHDAAGNVAYTPGPLSFLNYGIAGWYIAAIFCLLFFLRKRLSRQERSTIFGITVVTAAVIGVMMLSDKLMLSGIAICISILSMLFTLQNPEDMLDTVSGAYNSTALLSFFDSAAQNSRPLHILVITLDGIDGVFHSVGTVAGNALVAEVGSFLSRQLRRPWLFRVSNSRFALIFPSVGEMERAAERIGHRFQSPWSVEESQIELGITGRYFTTPATFRGAAEYMAILREAAHTEIARGSIKKLDWDESYLQSVRYRAELRQAVRHAIRTGEGLSLHFQPIVRAEDGSMAGAEELLRLHSSHLGPISPAEFVPLAEQEGLATLLDAYVLDRSCRFLNAHPELDMLDINLSATEFFHDPSQEIMDIVSRNGVDPRRIRLEITETAAAVYPEMVRRCMQYLMKQGFTFAMDDFGTGYSNLSNLMELPFSVIKLDRSLLGDTENERRLLQLMLHFCREMGTETVMEGVETETQLARVRQDGVSYMQGYLLGRPMAEEDFVAYLSARQSV